ncbi:Veg family protein [Fusibacter sp. JL298sf-3]
MATRQTLDGIKSNVMACLGKKVILKTDKGKRKAKVSEGVIEKAFPSVFTVRVDQGQDSERTVSYSYSDILTETVEVTLFGNKELKELKEIS